MVLDIDDDEGPADGSYNRDENGWVDEKGEDAYEFILSSLMMIVDGVWLSVNSNRGTRLRSNYVATISFPSTSVMSPKNNASYKNPKMTV